MWALVITALLGFCSGLGTHDPAADHVLSFNPFLNLYAPLKTENMQCAAEALNFKNAAEQRKTWALKMLDASSKIPSSLLDGNVVDLGNFDQCLAILSEESINNMKTIGRYCLIKASFKNENAAKNQSNELTVKDLGREWTWSVCIPAACTEEDLIKQLKTFSSITDNIHRVHCKSLLEDSSPPASSWLMV